MKLHLFTLALVSLATFTMPANADGVFAKLYAPDLTYQGVPTEFFFTISYLPDGNDTVLSSTTYGTFAVGDLYFSSFTGGRYAMGDITVEPTMVGDLYSSLDGGQTVLLQDDTTGLIFERSFTFSQSRDTFVAETPGYTPPAGAPAPLAGAGLLSFLGAGGLTMRRRAKRLLSRLCCFGMS